MVLRFMPASVLCLAMLLGAGAPVRAQSPRQTHTVVAGEVLIEVAARYGVTVPDLLAWNELDSDRIRIGQQLVVSPERPVENDPESLAAWRTTYTVLRGDNLTRIAERVGVSLEALTEANPEMRRDRIRPGQRLNLVGPTRVVDHVVQRGETIARIASRFEVRPLDLTDWNPVLRRRGVETGMTLRIYTDVRISRSESVGAPNEGTLENAVRLPEGRAYVVRTGDRAFATHETVQWIVEAFDAALDADPDMPRLRIHDLSAPTGGRIAGHRSHQNGRDADIAYYRRQCRNGEPCFMNRTRPEDLDVAHQWRLFRYWLERDLATHIFVDYALQAPLYEYARTHGATAAELDRWFQYPREKTEPRGIIRHFAQHDDHFHVRFVCPRGDDRCTDPVRRAPARQPTAPANPRNPEPADEDEPLELVASASAERVATTRERPSEDTPSTPPEEPAAEVLEPPAVPVIASRDARE